jgi:hypothetical protein
LTPKARLIKLHLVATAKFVTVITQLAQIVFRSPARRARALAFVLLASLSWGATAEVNHHHGTQSAGRVSLLSTVSNQITAERIESPCNESPSKGTSSRDECLICQLHQNLFAKALSHALHSAPATDAVSRNPTSLVSYSSQFNTPQRGRAPPSIL